MHMNRVFFAAFPFSVALLVACAHPQQVSLTSAMTELPPPKDGGVELTEANKDGGVELTEGNQGAVEATVKPDASPGEPSFADLTAALGDGKIDLAIDHTDAPNTKGLDSSGYAAVGAVHQTAADGVKHGGEVQVSGGISVAEVHGVVRDNASRLRSCYERALQADPRLAGRVMVSFSVDARGAVGDVEALSETLPGDVTSCVTTVFSSLSFTTPKAPPAKIVVPVDFNKDS
jgi:hypothetical protein